MQDLRFDNQHGSSVSCDLVDVVRCKKCEFWMGDENALSAVCLMWSSAMRGSEKYTKYNGFCHHGTRKGHLCESMR